MTNPADRVLIDRLKKIVGESACATVPADMAAYLEEQRGYFESRAAAVVRPGTVEEVAEVVRECVKAGVPVVPQGGNTGLTGGAVAADGDVIINLSRMRRIRAVDPINDTITVDAGCTLAQVQDAARKAGRLFPLSLASEGSCQIGGNLSSNAGGNAVVRYGNARELVLGLEVVLPDGRVWDGLRALRKDNTGYDLKQLFVGAEGTLGIITGAVCRLFPTAHEIETALFAVASVSAATALLGVARELAGETVNAFELISRRTLEFVLKNTPSSRDPLPEPYDWYVLVEISTARQDSGLRDTLEKIFTRGFEAELIADGVVAESDSQRKELWRLRESASDAQKFEGASLKHDISVPVSCMPDFIARATTAVEREISGVLPVIFGHVGDGNVHFNLTQPKGMDSSKFLDCRDRVSAVVHKIAAEMGGSISAEHGVGLLKKNEILAYKSHVEMDIMRKLKRCLDPGGLMNPGKVL